jgi:hypothetical protein
MYFCSTESSRAGIWYHGILNAMVRGLQSPPVRFNGQVHQEESKKNAGFAACAHTDVMLQKLHPLAWTKDSPSSSVNRALWSTGEVDTEFLSNIEQFHLLFVS